MRELTPDEEALSLQVLEAVMPAYIGTQVIDANTLTRMRFALNQEGDKRHAADPRFPRDWKWRTRAVERSYLDGDNNTQFEHTGDIVARPIEIAGEIITWPREYEFSDLCPFSQRVDRPIHTWRFDGDDPYLTCCWCSQVRDAQSGRIIKEGLGG